MVNGSMLSRGLRRGDGRTINGCRRCEQLEEALHPKGIRLRGTLAGPSRTDSRYTASTTAVFGSSCGACAGAPLSQANTGT